MTGKMGYMRHQKGSFRGAARAATDRSKSGGMVTGRYDNLKLTEVGLWLFIPPQSYDYETYDKESKSVVPVTDSPFLAVPQHFVTNGVTKDKRPGRKGRVFNCSGGPGRDKPCYGCGVRAKFYAEKDSRRIDGVKDNAMPPVGISTSYAMGVTIAEAIAQVPVLERNGMQRKSAKGTPIFDKTPLPVLKHNKLSSEGLQMHFGQNVHWSFSVSYLSRLEQFDAQLANHCANCATELVAVGWTCPECGEIHEDPMGGVSGEDLAAGRDENRTCTRCHHTGAFVPELACPGCGVAEEGRLVGCFDLRFKAVPAGGDAKGTVLELVGVRPAIRNQKQPPRGHEGLFDRATYDKLCDNPLDVKRIFAPDGLGYQKDNIFDPVVIAGVDPAKTTWKDYSEAEEVDAGEDFLNDGD